MAITTAMQEQVSQLYVALFGRAPDGSGLGYWVQELNGGTSINQIAQEMYDTTDARVYYPSYMTNEAIVTSFYTNVLGRSPDAEGLAYWLAKLNGGESQGKLIVELVNAVVAYSGTDAAALTSQALFNNKVAVADWYGTNNGGVDNASTILAGVTADPTTVTAATSGTVATGTTYTLTTGMDTVVGTAANDVINAVSDAVVANTTLTGLDDINGGAGIDTINVLNVAGTLTINTTATVSNVEKLHILSGANAITANVSGWDGLQQVSVDDRAGAVSTIITGGNATSVSVTTVAGGSAAISDTGATDTLASVSIEGATVASTIASDALTSLTLTNTTAGATVTAAAGTRALGVTVDGVTAGTVVDATATTVNVTASGDDSTLTGVTAAAATTLNVGGSAAVNLGTVTAAAVTSIVSTNTAGVTIGNALNVGATFTGGAGDDSIILGASTKASTMGAGNDTVTLSGAALGAGGSVDGGTGNDVLVMTAANAATASGTTTFEGTIAGFEALEIGGMLANTAINLANVDDISYLVTNGGAFTLTVNGMASGGTLEIDAAQTGSVVNVTNALVGTADVLNVKIADSALVAAGTITAANVETIHLLTDDTAATPTGIQHTATLTAANATTLTVAGDAGVALTLTGSTALTSIDTSAVTKGAVSVTTVGTDSVTMTGGATNTTFNASSVDGTHSATITTGAGNDTITGGAGDDVIHAGNGTNTVVGGAGVDTIVGGTGVDTITGGAGADTLTGGAGADVFLYAAVGDSQGVTVDTITDFVSGTDKINLNAISGGTGAYLGEAVGYGAVLTALTAGGSAEAVLDTSTHTLYVDVNGDGILNANDMAIVLTGVNALVTADFVF